MNSNYFIFEKEKCVGCEACVVACINENGTQEPETWRNIHSSNPNKNPELPLFYMSMACNHCEDAPCMEYCPALAYSRGPFTGAVLHSADKCIGCKYCTWNCPYDAPKYNPSSGVIEKCNLCESRLLSNQKPACTSSCPTGALDFSFDKIDKSAIIPSVIVPVDTKPSVVIKELTNENGPRVDTSLFETIKTEKTKPKQKPKISATEEWPLVLFTFIVSIMVAIIAMDILKEQPLTVKLLFLGAGGLAAGLSTFHLGKPLRAWRALLNIKKSWLSREILFFGLFYIASVFDLLLFDLPNWSIVLIGVLLLISVDMLYQPAQLYWKTKWHTAQTTFIGLSFYLLFGKFYWVLGLVICLRMYLFISKNVPFSFKSKANAIMKINRILSIILTIIFILVGFPYGYTILLFGIGELIDRILFYNELEVPDVRKALDLK